MNVAGFTDANASALRVELDAGLVVAIASLPAIAVLKLFAWCDRRAETPKDALDLAALVLVYHEADPDRVYTIPAEVLEGLDFNIELGGAWLFGNHARRAVGVDTAAKLIAVFDDTRTTNELELDIALGLKGRAEPEAESKQLLAQFVGGFRHH